jgi:hypothetical protein
MLYLDRLPAGFWQFDYRLDITMLVILREAWHRVQGMYP